MLEKTIVQYNQELESALVGKIGDRKELLRSVSAIVGSDLSIASAELADKVHETAFYIQGDINYNTIYFRCVNPTNQAHQPLLLKCRVQMTSKNIAPSNHTRNRLLIERIFVTPVVYNRSMDKMTLEDSFLNTYRRIESRLDYNGRIVKTTHEAIVHHLQRGEYYHAFTTFNLTSVEAQKEILKLLKEDKK